MFSSFLVHLLQTSTAAETFGNLEESPTTHMCPSQRSSRQPFLPRAGHSLRISLGARGSHTCLPSNQVIGRQPPIEITLVNQITHNNQLVLIYQLFQTSSKTLEQWLSSLDTTEPPREIHKLLTPEPHPRISDLVALGKAWTPEVLTAPQVILGIPR